MRLADGSPQRSYLTTLPIFRASVPVRVSLVQLDFEETNGGLIRVRCGSTVHSLRIQPNHGPSIYRVGLDASMQANDLLSVELADDASEPKRMMAMVGDSFVEVGWGVP